MTPSNPQAEPLEEGAPLAHRLARRLCAEAPGGGTCRWNHGLWLYLRLFGLITTPVHHTEFFARAFRAAAARANGGAVRLLVSGAADFGMLSQVLRAFRSAGSEPLITVVDVCETPLELSRWYAGREGCEIQTCRSDILQFETAERFDMVCTHSFLGQFDGPARARLAAKWFGLLRPGGRVATVNRIRPGMTGPWVGFDARQAEAFLAEVDACIARATLPADVDASVLRDMARDYAAKFGAWPVASESQIRELFEGAGLRMEELQCALVDTQGGGRISGPSTPGGALYACILAMRPD